MLSFYDLPEDPEIVLAPAYYADSYETTHTLYVNGDMLRSLYNFYAEQHPTVSLLSSLYYLLFFLLLSNNYSFERNYSPTSMSCEHGRLSSLYHPIMILLQRFLL